MRDIIIDIIGIGGLSTTVAGLWMAWPPLGVVGGGLAAMLIATALAQKLDEAKG